jgi:hypothetical protein
MSMWKGIWMGMQSIEEQRNREQDREDRRREFLESIAARREDIILQHTLRMREKIADEAKEISDLIAKGTRIFGDESVARALYESGQLAGTISLIEGQINKGTLNPETPGLIADRVRTSLGDRATPEALNGAVVAGVSGDEDKTSPEGEAAAIRTGVTSALFDLRDFAGQDSDPANTAEYRHRLRVAQQLVADAFEVKFTEGPGGTLIFDRTDAGSLQQISLNLTSALSRALDQDGRPIPEVPPALMSYLRKARQNNRTSAELAEETFGWNYDQESPSWTQPVAPPPPPPPPPQTLPTPGPAVSAPPVPGATWPGRIDSITPGSQGATQLRDSILGDR